MEGIINIHLRVYAVRTLPALSCTHEQQILVIPVDTLNTSKHMLNIPHAAPHTWAKCFVRHNAVGTIAKGPKGSRMEKKKEKEFDKRKDI